MADEIMPEIKDTSRYGEREVSFRNLYETHHGFLSCYDLEAYDAWTPDRKSDELPKNLPYEITYDDRRADLRFSEQEFRSLMAQGMEILAKWDAKKR